MLQFCSTSMNAPPLWAAARRNTACSPLTSTSMQRATKVALAPSATAAGISGLSMDPIGTDLAFLPSSEVGECWPLVSP